MPDSFLQDPDERVDYARDWQASGDLVDGDTIVTSTWTPDTGITVVSDSHTDTVATVRVSGGTAGNRYGITNHIVTASGQEFDHTLWFLIGEK
jgi:hypothetical protein